MKTVIKLTLVALASGGILGSTLTNASAKIVCNKEGACWHTATNYEYRPEFGLFVHPDDWKWKQGEQHTWREHDGRGFWAGEVWKSF